MIQEKKILIVDDNHVAREMVKLMLEKRGFSVVQLSGGASILETITVEQPQLVLLDLIMPDMDGNQTLEMIRTRYTESELPVIMVTSQSESVDFIESLKRGANDYITKPIQFDVALRRIQTQLTLKTQTALITHTKEMAAIHATITTFNHEINNPLAIATGQVHFLRKKYGEEPEFPKLEKALLRIAEVIKKTGTLLESSSIDFEQYAGASQMINLKSKAPKTE